MGHWYDKKGRPRHKTIGLNGFPRDTTLRDAKKFGYVPSVTEIIKLRAPSYHLDRYKENQIIDAAWQQIGKDQTYCQFKQEVLAKSVEHRDEAAKKGSIIHDELEKRLKGEDGDKKHDPVCLPVLEFLKTEFPDSEFIAEQSFYSNFGFGGTCDLHCKKTDVIIDYKTKAKDCVQGLQMYDSHEMQLAAYAAGLFTNCTKMSGSPPDRYILYISTETKANFKLIKSDRFAGFYKYWNMFHCLLELWKLEKGVKG